MFLTKEKIDYFHNNRAKEQTGAMCVFPTITKFKSIKGNEFAIEDGNPVFCFIMNHRCKEMDTSLENLLIKIETEYKIPIKNWNANV